MEITEVMIEAALKAWFGPLKPDPSEKISMKAAIEAALDAAPTGHGERG